jgi:hypothetical protein
MQKIIFFIAIPSCCDNQKSNYRDVVSQDELFILVSQGTAAYYTWFLVQQG